VAVARVRYNSTVHDDGLLSALPGVCQLAYYLR